MRESGYRHEFGLLGGGAVGASLIGRLPNIARRLGPIAAVSYRVASRISNTLKAGTAARTVDHLNFVRTILFHSPAEQSPFLLDLLHAADIRWAGKSLIFCDCDTDTPMLDRFRLLGASVATVRGSAVPGRLVIEGTVPAIKTVKSMARQLSMQWIELAEGSSPMFEAAMTLGTGVLTPLIHYAADLLRECGVRDSEAPGLAAQLFQQTVLDYAHSGKQSWTWYIREPRLVDLEAQIGTVPEGLHLVFRSLILVGLDSFGKHPEIAKALRNSREPNRVKKRPSEL